MCRFGVRFNSCMLFYILALVSSVLSGCSSYKPLPLQKHRSLPDLRMLVARVNSSPLIKRAAIDDEDGLSLDEIAMLALFNSPVLQVEREKYRVKQANAYDSGLLPDPQFNGNLDLPTGKLNNAVNAWTGGIGFDLNTLITHQTLLMMGSYQNKQAKLLLLWQAWQVIQQAKLLTIDLYFTNQKLQLIEEMVHTLERRYKQTRAGILEGNTTLETSGNDLSVLLVGYSQLRKERQNYNKTSHKLTRLMGVKSSSKITLAPFKPPFPLTKKMIVKALMTVEDSRPDLLALQAEYQAQEAKVNTEILSQFPALNIGISEAKDSGGLRTRGFNIGISLPLFNANRGGILIARASRKQLAKEYQRRVIQTRSIVDKLVQFNTVLSQQQEILARHLPNLRKLLFSARNAYHDGDIAGLSFINIESTWFNSRLEQLDLQRNRWRTMLSLSLLLMQQEIYPVMKDDSVLITSAK